MINNARLREKLGRPCSLKTFASSVDMAVAMVIQRKIPTALIPFTRKSTLDTARLDAEDEVKDMAWEQIHALAVQFETNAEMGNDQHKENKIKFEGMEEVNNG